MLYYFYFSEMVVMKWVANPNHPYPYANQMNIHVLMDGNVFLKVYIVMELFTVLIEVMKQTVQP